MLRIESLPALEGPDSIISSQVFKKQRIQMGRENAFKPFQQERDGMGRLNQSKMSQNNFSTGDLRKNVFTKAGTNISNDKKHHYQDMSGPDNVFVEQKHQYHDINECQNVFIEHEIIDGCNKKHHKNLQRFCSQYLKESNYEHLKNIDWAYAHAAKEKITDLCPEIHEDLEEQDLETQKQVFDKMLSVKQKKPTISLKNLRPAIPEEKRTDFDKKYPNLNWDGFSYFNGKTDFRKENKKNATMIDYPVNKNFYNIDRKRLETMDVGALKMMTSLRADFDMPVRNRPRIAHILPEHRNSSMHMKSQNDASGFDSILLRPESNVYSMPDTIVHGTTKIELDDSIGIMDARQMTEFNRNTSADKDNNETAENNEKQFFMPGQPKINSGKLSLHAKNLSEQPHGNIFSSHSRIKQNTSEIHDIMCLPNNNGSPIHKKSYKLADEKKTLSKADIYRKLGIKMPEKNNLQQDIKIADKPLTAEFIRSMGVKKEFYIPLHKFDMEKSGKVFEGKMDNYRSSEKNLKILNNYSKQIQDIPFSQVRERIYGKKKIQAD